MPSHDRFPRGGTSDQRGGSPEQQEAEPRQVQVRFVPGRDRNELVGEFVSDFGYDHPRKICFVERGYRGTQPQKDEEWIVAVVRDTQPGQRNGALLVRPVRRVKDITVEYIPDGEPLLDAQRLCARGQRGLVTADHFDPASGSEAAAKIAAADKAYNEARDKVATEAKKFIPSRPDKSFTISRTPCDVLGIVGEIKSAVYVAKAGIIEEITFIASKPQLNFRLEDRTITEVLTYADNGRAALGGGWSENIKIPDYQAATAYLGQPSEQKTEKNRHGYDVFITTWHMPDGVEIKSQMQPDEAFRARFPHHFTGQIKTNERQSIYAIIDFTGYGSAELWVGHGEQLDERNVKVQPAKIVQQDLSAADSELSGNATIQAAILANRQPLPVYRERYRAQIIAERQPALAGRLQRLQLMANEPSPSLTTQTFDAKRSESDNEGFRTYHYTDSITAYMLQAGSQSIEIGRQHSHFGWLSKFDCFKDKTSIENGSQSVWRMFLDYEAQQLGVDLQALHSVGAQVDYAKTPDQALYNGFDTTAETPESQQLHQKNTATVTALQAQCVDTVRKVQAAIATKALQEQQQRTLLETYHQKLQQLQAMETDLEQRIAALDLLPDSDDDKKLTKLRRSLHECIEKLSGKHYQSTMQNIKKTIWADPQAGQAALKTWLAASEWADIKRYTSNIEAVLAPLEYSTKYGMANVRFQQLDPLVQDKLLGEKWRPYFKPNQMQQLAATYQRLFVLNGKYWQGTMTQRDFDETITLADELTAALESAQPLPPEADQEAIKLEPADEVQFLIGVLANLETLVLNDKGSRETLRGLSGRVQVYTTELNKPGANINLIRTQIGQLRAEIAACYNKIRTKIPGYKDKWLSPYRQLWAGVAEAVKNNSTAQDAIALEYTTPDKLISAVRSALAKQAIPQYQRGQTITPDQLDSLIKDITNQLSS